MSSNNGKEVSVEDNPESKFLVEEHVDLTKSCLWSILERYYETVSIDAWRKNQVPSFITSNCRLACGYARLIHSFIMDQNPTGSPLKKVYIVEIGGGHGRFTFLLLRALEKYSPVWEDLGYSDAPFKYIFTDANDAGFSFLTRESSALVPYIRKGWLEIACYNGNDSEPGDIVFGLNKQETIPLGSSIVLICNYVLDSLLTDAIAINKEKAISKATVSVYSSQTEEDLTHPSIADRMTLSWSWKEISDEDFLSDTACSENKVCNAISEKEKSQDTEYMTQKEKLLLKYTKFDKSLYDVIKSYIDLDREMSFVLPLGAIKMLRRFYQYSNGNICVLIGDKGYPDDTEFISIKPPHIAIHGCMSFMVNLDAIKKYFCNLGGSYLATRYKDTFQITCILGGRKSSFPRVVASFIDSHEDLVPDNLLSIQKGFEQLGSNSASSPYGLKPYLGVLRYSMYDPFILWILRNGILANIGDFNIRQREDIILDLRSVYQNVYPLEINIDVFDLLAQICLKGGFVNEAIFYYNESLRCCPEMIHPSTFVNLAKCYQSQRNWKKAFHFCNEALKIDPNYPPALEFNSEYNPSRRLNYIIIGCYSSWIFTDIIPTIQFDAMYNCIGVVPTKSTVENAKKAFDHLQHALSCNQENEVFSYSPPKFFLEEISENSSLTDAISSVFRSNPQIEAVILDVPPSLLKPCMGVIWEFDKHVMTRSPAARDVATASEILSAKPPGSLWFDYSPYKFESALLQVFNIIKQHGRLYAINCRYDLPSEVQTKSNDFKNDELIARLIHSLSAIYIAIDGTLDWVFCPSSDNDNEKKTLFCGWSSPLWSQVDHQSLMGRIPPGKSPTKQSSTKSDEIHCTISTGFVKWENAFIQFDFHCDNCTLSLRKEGPIWIFLIKTPKGRYESKIQCVGLQSSNEKFRKLCKDFNPEQYNIKDSIGFSAWWDAIEKSKQSPVYFSYK